MELWQYLSEHGAPRLHRRTRRSSEAFVKAGGAGLPKMGTISNPLRCLVCCTGLASPDNSLPGRTHGVTRRLRALALADESVVDGPTPRRAPPSYVQRLIETPVEERGRIIEELRGEVGPVGALVVFKG
jgi:hypothetical protein